MNALQPSSPLKPLEPSPSSTTKSREELKQSPSSTTKSREELKQSPSSTTKSAEKLNEWPISAAAPLEEFRTRLEKAMQAYFSTIPAAEKTVTIRNVQENGIERFHLLNLAASPCFCPEDMRRVVIERIERKSEYIITESIPYVKSVPTYLFFKPKYFGKTTPAKMFDESDKHKSDLSYILTEINIGNAEGNYDLSRIKRRVKNHELVKEELFRQNQAERLYLEPQGLFRANNDEKSFVNSLKGALKTAFKRYGFKETPEVTLKYPASINFKNVHFTIEKPPSINFESLDLEKVWRTFYVEQDPKNKYIYNVAVGYQFEEPEFCYMFGTTLIRTKGNSEKEYKIVDHFTSDGVRANLKKIPAAFFPEEEAKIEAKRKAEITKRKAEITRMRAQIEKFQKEIRAIQEDSFSFDDSKSSEEKDSQTGSLNKEDLKDQITNN